MPQVVRGNCQSLPTWPEMYSHYTKVGDLIYLAGQIGQDVQKNLPDGVEAQMTQALSNVYEVLKAAGSDWEHTVKINIFLKRMEDFDAINAIYTKTLPEQKPARTCVQAGKLPRDCLVEIECIATPI